MRKKLKRTAVLIAAILFILLGFAGLVLPFLQGFLFLAIGLILLSLLSPAVRVFMYKHTVRFPRLHKIVENTEQWVIKYIGDV